jgi:soluble P-type ATPase
MLGKLDYLAERYVFYGQKKRTKEEIVMELKRRLEPIEYDIKRRR